MSRARRATARREATRQLCQAGRADSTQARWPSRAKNTGRVPPSQIRVARSANRRSGGVVRTTYPAAAPAEMINALAIVREVAAVTRDQPLDGPPLPRIPSDPLPNPD